MVNLIVCSNLIVQRPNLIVVLMVQHGRNVLVALDHFDQFGGEVFGEGERSETGADFDDIFLVPIKSS